MDCLQARNLALAARGQAVLTRGDEEALWWLLQRHAAPHPAAQLHNDAPGGGCASICGAELCLDYDRFTQVAAECREAIGPSADAYFQARTFMQLARGPAAALPIAAFFRHCAARSALIRLRVELGLLDTAGHGALTPSQLLPWLERRAPAAACRQAGVGHVDWCTSVAARLQLLHARRGRLPIKDLAACPDIRQLSAALVALEAAQEAAAGLDANAAVGSCGGGAAEMLAASRGVLPGWASPEAAAALRQRFAELDADGDGLLSQEEFASLSQGTMTALAIQRLFAHHCPQQFGSGCEAAAATPRAGGMGFAAFCAFCAAWEQRHRPCALRYFFPLLDLRGCGSLSQADLYTLFREVHRLWRALGQHPDLRVEDVLAEVNDLLRAPDPDRITMADLQRCGAAGTIIGLLLDVNLFWEYENREALQQQAAAAARGDQAEPL